MTNADNTCEACEGSGLLLGFRDIATARGEHDTVDTAEDCDRCAGTGRIVPPSPDWPDEPTCKDEPISMLDLVRGRF